MFSPLFPAELMQIWSRLGTQMMRTQAECLGATVLCAPARSGGAAASGADTALWQVQDMNRQALDAASRMPEHFGRVAQEMLSFHPGRELVGPMLEGVHLASQAVLHWMQSCIERRIDTRPW